MVVLVAGSSCSCTAHRRVALFWEGRGERAQHGLPCGKCVLLTIAVWGMQFRRPEAALERSYALSKFVCMNASKEAAHCSLWLALLCLVWVNVQVIIIAFLGVFVCL